MPLSVLRRAAVGAAALALVAGAAAPAAAQRTFSSFTVFGDSFSDVGNAQRLAALFGQTQPARFTNGGSVWIDVLGSRIGRTGDVRAVFPLPTMPGVPAATGVYAVGGALTTATGLLPSTGTLTQLNAWCLGATTGCNRAADAGGLYALFAGGNDVRLVAAQSQAVREAATIQAANNIADQAGRVLGAGARSILLGYLPDLGSTPDRVGGPFESTLRDLTRLFNTTLEGRVAGLRTQFAGANVFDLRLDNLFANVLGQPGTFGFTNTNGSCAAQGQLPACAGYVFADGLHPTTAAHALIGEAAYQLVAFDRNVAVIPEPSTYALLGAGLLAVGGIAARRKRAA